MPWKVIEASKVPESAKKANPPPKDATHAVVKDDGTVVKGGWHKSEKEAQAHKKAIYANYEEGTKEPKEEKEMKAMLDWARSREAQVLKAEIDKISFELSDALRFGYDQASQYYFGLQGDLQMLTKRYKQGLTDAIKHGDHDQSTHGNWARNGGGSGGSGGADADKRTRNAAFDVDERARDAAYDAGLEKESLDWFEDLADPKRKPKSVQDMSDKELEDRIKDAMIADSEGVGATEHSYFRRATGLDFDDALAESEKRSKKPSETYSQRLLREHNESQQAALKPSADWTDAPKDWGSELAKHEGVEKVHDREVHGFSADVGEALEDAGWKKGMSSSAGGGHAQYQRTVDGEIERAELSPTGGGRHKVVMQKLIGDPRTASEKEAADTMSRLMEPYNKPNVSDEAFQEMFDLPDEKRDLGRVARAHSVSRAVAADEFEAWIDRRNERVTSDAVLAEEDRVAASKPIGNIDKELGEIQEDYGISDDLIEGARASHQDAVETSTQGRTQSGSELSSSQISKLAKELGITRAEAANMEFVTLPDGRVVPIIETKKMKARIDAIQAKLNDAVRFGHDLSSDDYYLLQGELEVVTKQYEELKQANEER